MYNMQRGEFKMSSCYSKYCKLLLINHYFVLGSFHLISLLLLLFLPGLASDNWNCEKWNPEWERTAVDLKGKREASQSYFSKGWRRETAAKGVHAKPKPEKSIFSIQLFWGRDLRCRAPAEAEHIKESSDPGLTVAFILIMHLAVGMWEVLVLACTSHL